MHTCTICALQPEPTRVFNHPWHDTVGVGDTATVRFSGIPGTLYGVCLPSSFPRLPTCCPLTSHSQLTPQTMSRSRISYVTIMFTTSNRSLLLGSTAAFTSDFGQPIYRSRGKESSINLVYDNGLSSIQIATVVGPLCATTFALLIAFIMRRKTVPRACFTFRARNARNKCSYQATLFIPPGSP